MPDSTTHQALVKLPAPTPRCLLTIRPAEAKDVSFIDGLQKMHSHMVGWSPRKQIEANIEAGNVLVAEEVNDKVTGWQGDKVKAHPLTPSPCHPLTPLGYCIARDQYLKRDDVGIIYQLNVLPLKQRNLIGASLVKATFERAAYGCKLFCCWCAQDIQANYFWESIGFIPLAFRTGSASKQRIHIFWQRRVRDEANTGAPGTMAVPSTPYWFPSQTQNGAVRDDRIVLPIPPGTHWRDAKPVILPGLPEVPKDLPKTLPGGALVKPRPETSGGPKISHSQKVAIIRSKSKHLKGLPPGKAVVVTAGGIRYIERGDYVPEAEAPKPKREPPRKPRKKNDPKYVAAARELRDRYLEQINAPGPGSDRMLPAAHGKYDVSRQLETAPTTLKQTPLLKAA